METLWQVFERLMAYEPAWLTDEEPGSSTEPAEQAIGRTGPGQTEAQETEDKDA